MSGRFQNSDKFAVVDMPTPEALLVMDELSAMADSPAVGDRIHASDLYNTSGEHASLEVVERSIEMSRWLMSQELFASSSDLAVPETLDPDDPEATIRLSVDGIAYGLKIDLSSPTPVHPQIQKNVIRELARVGARREPEMRELAVASVDMLGIVSHRSLDAEEARKAIGWAGRETPYRDLGERALGYLSGTIKHDSQQIILFSTEPLQASLIGMHAVGDRPDQALASEVDNALDEARIIFSQPEFDQVFASAARRVLGNSPFTEGPRG